MRRNVVGQARQDGVGMRGFPEEWRWDARFAIESPMLRLDHEAD